MQQSGLSSDVDVAQGDNYRLAFCRLALWGSLMHSEHASPRVTTASLEQQPTDGASTDDRDHDLEPVAYLVESWNDMSESWEVSVRLSKASVPSHNVRSVTPLVAVPDETRA